MAIIYIRFMMNSVLWNYWLVRCLSAAFGISTQRCARRTRIQRCFMKFLWKKKKTYRWPAQTLSEETHADTHTHLRVREIIAVAQPNGTFRCKLNISDLKTNKIASCETNVYFRWELKYTISGTIKNQWKQKYCVCAYVLLWWHRMCLFSLLLAGLRFTVNLGGVLRL